ncbi:hypothetical protein BDW22DRAFT_131091 [Trametopsis cervina]|nr:hypothetical protein BDW22DRAFT_131091 [Trametopsis cervina]
MKDASLMFATSSTAVKKLGHGRLVSLSFNIAMSLDVGPYSLDACTGDREVDTGEMMYVNYNANNSHGPASPRIVVPPLWRSEQDLSLSYDCGITKLPEPFDDFLYYPDGVPPPIYPDWLASLPLHGPAPKAFVERPLYATAASPPLEPPCIAPRDTLLFPDFGSVKAVSDLSTRNVPPLAHDDELIFNICEELDGNAFIHDSMGLFEVRNSLMLYTSPSHHSSTVESILRPSCHLQTTHSSLVGQLNLDPQFTPRSSTRIRVYSTL